MANIVMVYAFCGFPVLQQRAVMRRGCVIPAAVSLAAVDLRRLAREEWADLAAFLATLSPRQ